MVLSVTAAAEHPPRQPTTAAEANVRLKMVGLHVIKKINPYMISSCMMILFAAALFGCASSSKRIGDQPYYKETPWPLNRVSPSVIGIEKNETTYEALDGGPLHRKPRVIYYVKADYPYLARAAGIEGDAILEVVIGIAGNVENAKIIESRITPSMERSLLEAAAQFKYTPGRRRNKTIKCVGRHLIRFTLNADVIKIDVK